jgi:hypothetical protein
MDHTAFYHSVQASHPSANMNNQHNRSYAPMGSSFPNPSLAASINLDEVCILVIDLPFLLVLFGLVIDSQAYKHFYSDNEVLHWI